jgi:uncharacterized protein YjbI with pentapeptide repeats
MLTRRNREAAAGRTEVTPFAARAKDLGALRDAVVDAAGVGTGLWLSYLFVLFYFAIAAGAVTHRDLLLENPVKLPFLNVELPLKAFFVLGPLVFLIVHAYVLLHFVLLAGKIGAFQSELEAQIACDDTRARLRRQLPSNIFVQFIAGPREVREGIIGFLLRQVAQISLVVGPIALLILFQLQFLPYHSEWITTWQRTAVVIDLVLLWFLWPPIARGETTLLAWREFRRVKMAVLALASFLPLLLVFLVATFPGEWLSEDFPGIASLQLHKLLVVGRVDYVTGSFKGLWSNVLVVPSFDIGNRLKVDAENRLSISSDAVVLRGRSLEGAVLVNAHLRKADFNGAQLQHANLSGADLREATFDSAQLQEANLDHARLQGAVLNNAQLQGAWLNRAQLQGAWLADAQLQGASLDSAQLQVAMLYSAQLQGASLLFAQLQGAGLSFAELQGAWLYDAELQGAWLNNAQMQGATLDSAQLQGALLDWAQLQGASLTHVFVWRVTPPAADDAKSALVGDIEPGPKYDGNCPSRKCDWSDAHYAELKLLIEQAQPSFARDQALRQIQPLGQTPYQEDPKSADAWRSLEQASRPSAETYPTRLAETLIKIGCGGAGAPYVIRGLIRRLGDSSDSGLRNRATVAKAFLDEAHCQGALALSAQDRARLQGIADHAPRPPLIPRQSVQDRIIDPALRLAVAAIDDAGGTVHARLENPDTPFSDPAAAFREFLIDFGDRHFSGLLSVFGDQRRVIDLLA